MKKYTLIAKEIKTYVGEFDTREEAEEMSKNLEMDDLKTNVNLTYEIILSEDYIENEMSELKQKIKIAEEKKSSLINDIVKDLNYYKALLDKLTD